MAIWHEAKFRRLRSWQLAEVAHKSHGCIHHFKAELAATDLHYLRSFTNLRVLHIAVCNGHRQPQCVNPVLPCLPLLEEFWFISETNPFTSWPAEIEFPPLRFLAMVCCHECALVSGIHNLHALTKLELCDSWVDCEEAWPASLQEVVIVNQDTYIADPRTIERIAALPQLTRLSTDWSFVDSYQSSSEQVAFLLGIATLERVTVSCPSFQGIPLQIICERLGAVLSLRELILESVKASDADMLHLARLTNLQHFSISEAPDLTSCGLRHVSSLPNLIKLSIASCSSISDYSCVGGCSQLQELCIQDCSRHLCLAEVQAITQLQHMVTLHVQITLAEPRLFSQFCTMRHLQELEVWITDRDQEIPPAVFASLPTLCRLEGISLMRIKRAGELVDLLMQMRRLKRIILYRSDPEDRLSAEDEGRLRDALPRLETLLVQ